METVAMSESKLIVCPDCGAQMSPNAEACPTCGRGNDWVHPTLEKVIAHLRDQDFQTQYEVRGQEMFLRADTKNVRQSIGWACGGLSIVLLVGGLFSSTLLAFSFLFLVIAGALTLFGLNAFTRHDLHIDLRKPGGTVGDYDAAFWAAVLDIINTGRQRSDQNAPDV